MHAPFRQSGGNQRKIGRRRQNRALPEIEIEMRIDISLDRTVVEF
jgi:hypothetical protein